MDQGPGHQRNVADGDGLDSNKTKGEERKELSYQKESDRECRGGGGRAAEPQVTEEAKVYFHKGVQDGTHSRPHSSHHPKVQKKKKNDQGLYHFVGTYRKKDTQGIRVQPGIPQERGRGERADPCSGSCGGERADRSRFPIRSRGGGELAGGSENEDSFKPLRQDNG